MLNQKAKIDKSTPVVVLPPMIRSGPEIRCFQQTPSDADPMTRSDISPHALFHYFTAGIILQNKVFIR